MISGHVFHYEEGPLCCLNGENSERIAAPIWWICQLIVVRPAWRHDQLTK